VGAGTKDHLPAWAVNAGGAAGNALGTGCNVVDCTTGATLTSFGTKTIVWDGTDVTGYLVADGTYKVTIQETWNHSTSTVTSSFTFTKGATADLQTPAATTSFTAMTLNWVPGVAGINESTTQSPVITVYPNPTNTGIFNVDFTKADNIKVMNILGEVVYDQKVDAATITKSIDLSNLANGIYFIYVFDGKKSSKAKLILNK
jgi:Secretion system C-terminal sorting domain